jgi:ribulose-5-phosphate 4-epimerase/fuculose-1-phosphate aldolase
MFGIPSFVEVARLAMPTWTPITSTNIITSAKTIMNASPIDEDALFHSPEIVAMRQDLALALRAAAYHGLGEGVCNHFSVALPGDRGLFLLNPRGLMWSEVKADDVVIVDALGNRVAGRHEVEPTAMFIHAAVHNIARKRCVLHTHMPYATALTLTEDCGLDTTLSQNAMRYHGRISLDRKYNGLALDAGEGERIAHAMNGSDIVFLSNHGVVVCGERIDYAYDYLYYLERACLAQVLALSTGRALNPVDPALAERVANQVQSERLQSELFFAALRRTLGEPA